ncbi:hypothetical protein Tco_0060396 [Tanacetum coccineum]
MFWILVRPQGIDRWPLIRCGPPRLHIQKIYNGKKAALKERHWIPDSDGTYDLERQDYPRLFFEHFEGILEPEDKALYEEMLRLQGLGSNTETGVPYTKDEIMAPSSLEGKQEGATFPVLVGFCQDRARSFHLRLHARTPLMSSDDKFSQMLTQLESQPEIGGGSGSGGRGDDEQGDDEDDGEDGEDEDDS